MKPGLSEYLKVQNLMSYKLTGIMEDETGVSFAEKNYAKSKCIIDFVLLIVYMTVLLFGFSIMLRIFSSTYNQLFNHTEYDPNIGLKSMGINLELFAVIYLLDFILVPALMKGLRILFGFRWYFVKFEEAENLHKNIDSLDKISYLEFYNNRIAFHCDIFFYSLKKNNKLKQGYFENSGIEDSGIVLSYIYQFIICVLPLGFVFFYDIPAKEIILYSSMILLYLLSHMAAYLRWKSYYNRSPHLKEE